MAQGYRLAGEADRPGIERTLRLCFNLSAAHAGGAVERAGLEEIRVLDTGSSLGAMSFLIPMGIYFGGRSVSNLGIGAVGVPPEHRGNGFSVEMMRAVLQEGRDRGFAISTLHPATQTVYRNVGYQLFGGYWEIRMPIRTIGVRDRIAAVRRYEEADREAVRALQSRYARGCDGHLDRGEYIWKGVHHVRDEAAEGYVVLEDDALTGYCFLLQEPVEDNAYDLRLTDVVASTPTAARRLLTFLSSHASLAREAIFYGGPQDSLIPHLPEDHYRLRLRHFMMLRLLDIKRAFEARGYPKHVRGKLELFVEDDLFEEQTGAWTLDVSGGYAELSRGGSAALRTDARGLAALFGQYQPAHRLASLGWLEADADTLDLARSLFAGPQAVVTEMF